MTTSTNRKVQVGAYPIKHHRDCREHTRKDVSYPEELKVGPTDALQGRFDDGNRFEAETTASMLDTFTAQRWRVINVVCGRKRRKDDRLSAREAIAMLESGLSRRRYNVVSIEIPNRDLKRHRNAAERVTAAAMAAGVDVILGGRISGDGRVGEPDLLLRADPSNRRKHHFRYYGGDFKDHKSFQGTAKPRPWLASTLDTPFVEFASTYEAVGTPQLNDSLQLVHYWYLLDAVGRATTDRVGGIIGREGTLIWRDLDRAMYEYNKSSAFDVYDAAYDSYRSDIAHELARLDDPSIPAASGPEWQQSCKECPWREVCHDELREANHITLLPGITPLKARSHYDCGITSTGDLARLDSRTARLIDRQVDTANLLELASSMPSSMPVTAATDPATAALLSAEGIERVGQLSLLDERTSRYASTKVKGLAGAVDQARVAMVQRVHRARGVDTVSIPRTAIELDVDIEDDGGGICYLIGVRESIRTRSGLRTEYIPFVTWEHTPEAEAENFAKFWTYMMSKLDWAARTHSGAVRAFYYTEHESRYFKALAERHEGIHGVPTVDEVLEFCASDTWVDIHRVVSKELVWPTEDLSLKSLAKYARFMWRDETPGGANSVAWYRQQLEEGDSQLGDELRQRLLDYNEDDVAATWELREFISRMGEARRPGLKLPSVASLDAKWGPRRPARRRAALAGAA